MQILFATLLSLLPKAFIYLFAKLLTEKMVVDIVKTVVLFALHKLAEKTATKLDDDLLVKLEQAWKEPNE